MKVRSVKPFCQLGSPVHLLILIIAFHSKTQRMCFPGVAGGTTWPPAAGSSSGFCASLPTPALAQPPSCYSGPLHDDAKLQKADASWKEGMKQTPVVRLELHPQARGTLALALPACLHLLM